MMVECKPEPDMLGATLTPDVAVLESLPWRIRLEVRLEPDEERPDDS